MTGSTSMPMSIYPSFSFCCQILSSWAGKSERRDVAEACAHAKTDVCSYDMEGNAAKCVESYCDLANKKTE